MTEPKSKPVQGISRRTFCLSALGAAVALHAGGSRAVAGQRSGKVRFFKNLAPGHLGVRANQQEALDYAVKYAFEGIAPSPGEFADRSAAEIKAWLATMADKGIRYGAAGLPVEFRRDEETFKDGLAKLPQQAKVMQQLGVTRVATWILPGSNSLTYLENFKRHERRLRAAAKMLDDHGIRLGLEFVGPRTSRARNRFPFICTAKGMMELTNAISTPNTGLLVDSWHWYTSHGTVEELLGLSNKDIVHVHVNDAPAG
ncbi:MAG: sugar phosphate isomerase/epimerase, partial [Phycisphaerales bacterium]